MTVVPGPPVRPTGFDSFHDMPDLPDVAAITADGIEFEGPLTAKQVDAVRARITSRDDDDQAKRAKIRAASAANATNLAQMLAAYTLGDPVPDAVLPK